MGEEKRNKKGRVKKNMSFKDFLGVSPAEDGGDPLLLKERKNTEHTYICTTTE